MIILFSDCRELHCIRNYYNNYCYVYNIVRCYLANIYSDSSTCVISHVLAKLLFIMKNAIRSLAAGWNSEKERVMRNAVVPRDSENLWPLPGDIYGAGACIPDLTHFFVEYYLCTPSGCKYSCGTRVHLPCIALLAAANRNKCPSRRLKYQSRDARSPNNSPVLRSDRPISAGILFASSIVPRVGTALHNSLACLLVCSQHMI